MKPFQVNVLDHFIIHLFQSDQHLKIHQFDTYETVLDELKEFVGSPIGNQYDEIVIQRVRPGKEE